MENNILALLFGIAFCIWIALGHLRKKEATQKARFLCKQRGYTFEPSLPLIAFAMFQDPPWLLEPGIKEMSISDVLLHTSARGRFIAGDFAIPSDDSECPNICQTVIAVKLTADACQQVLNELLDASEDENGSVNSLVLPNGMNIVNRGDCIYVFFHTFGRRAPRMTLDEKLLCFRAIVNIADRNYADAHAKLGGIQGISTSSVASRYFFSLAGCALIVWASVAFGLQGFTITTGIVLFIWVGVAWQFSVNRRKLHGYLQKK